MIEIDHQQLAKQCVTVHLKQTMERAVRSLKEIGYDTAEIREFAEGVLETLEGVDAAIS